MYMLFLNKQTSSEEKSLAIYNIVPQNAFPNSSAY